MTSDPSPSVSATDIAIVGMAAHLPGAPDVRQYWKNLRQGVESMHDRSEAELVAAGVPSATVQRADYVRRSVILEGLDQFDAGFFGYSPKDAAITDPQHRHFLEACWEALEDAGHTPEGFGRPIGVFAGSGMTAYLTFNLLSNAQLVDDVGLFLLRHTGNDKDFLTTRVSYLFDLRGPSVNVQTACSTSLVAVHLAAQSLLSGECDMALAGGVTILLPHGRGYVFHEGEILSPDGFCRPFDQASRGTVFGSGAGVVVLRRLADALADGDHVYAVIKGSAINNDGALKVGYLAPSVDGQAQAVAEALSVAGVEADTISYIEAHGTATPVGDPIEVAALTQAFRAGTERRGFCGLGSVKSNIGHLDTAAGVASLIKVAMALEQRELPPSLHFEAPNPQIDFASSPFYVNARLQPWKSTGGPLRAGVNSLGVGGTNAFAIVEEAPRRTSGAASRPVQLVCLSARSNAALDAATERLRAHLQAQSDSRAEVPLADVAWTLQSGRKAFAFRRTFAARSTAEARALLESRDRERVWTHKVAGREPSIVFLLSGGGAQYPGMGRDLHAQEPVYRAELERCLDLMGPKLGPVVRRLLLSVPATADAQAEMAREMTLPWFQLPALFATEYALARMWMSFGLQPAAMLGHSLGENTAACLAGVMSLEDAVGLVALRGELLKQVAPGGMLSVCLSPESLAPFLGADLVLAVVNAPELCVASGPRAAVDALESRLREREIDCTRIHIDVAGHSPMFDQVLPAFGAYLRKIRLSPPGIPFVSNRTGTWITDTQATDPEYWVGHLRHAVLFSQGLKTLMQDGTRLFLEVGPGNTLSSLARIHADAGAAKSIVSSLRHRDEKVDDLDFALSQLGKLWCAGARPDWRALHGRDRRLRVPLPTYPFERQSFWIEPGRAAAAPSDAPGAPGALQRLPDLASWFHVPVWRPAELPAALHGALHGAPASAPLRWLVFEDEGGLGEAFSAHLLSLGHGVVSVREGARFERLSDTEYAISPQEREDYTALLEDLAAREKLPQRIVHLWMVTGSEDTAVTTTFFHWVQERGFYSLLFLGQALANAALTGGLHMAVVSNGMQAVAGELLRHPVKAAVLGACKVIPREIADVTCTSIDVDWPDSTRHGGATNGAHLATSCARLGVEIASLPSNAVVAWRAGRRYERAFEPAPLPALPAGRSAVRAGATYVITGGLGGIGLAVAAQLARSARVNLVLLGRQPMPPRSEWSPWLAAHGELDATSRRLRQIMDLEASGADVMVASADVANIEELRQVLDDARARFGAIHGLIHAAGVVEDSVLSAKTPAAVDRVFTPKVHGTLLLDQLLSGEPLDFFVVFSSTSAWLGPAGQIDYAAANAFLDAFAVHRSARPGARTIAVGWGVWSDVGMAARLVQPAPTAPRAGAVSRDVGAQHPPQHPLQHPLLGRQIVDGPSEIAWSAEYSPRTHWILSEHRLADGTALVPGTGYLEIARAALTRPGAALELRDVSFVAPLAVADDETRAVLVRLRAEDGDWNLEVSSRPADAPAGTGWDVHVQGRAARSEQPQPARLALASIAARCTTVANDALDRQRRHLRFGPRWDVVRELRFGDGEALARLELPEPWRGDQEQFQLHPALLDLATGFALRLIPGYDAHEVFWAPLSYRRVRVHAALPARVFSHARRSSRRPATTDVALFDVTLCDETGAVLLEVEEFALRRFESSAVLAPSTPRAAVGRSLRADAGGGLVHVDETLRRLVEQGIRPHEGCEALERVLASDRSGAIAVSSLDLGALTAAIDAHSAQETAAPSAHFARPELATDYVAPRDELETALARLWQELLGVERVGVQDNFFELGGYSLIAVRLFSRVKKAWKLEFPLSVLFEAPTVETLAARMREERGEAAPVGAPATAPKRRKLRHLVPMHGEGSHTRPPFFLVAGMYGNVMNLRHLAGHLGADQPVYGIQARGLEGTDEPHQTFEEMATAYIEDMRTVQPHGPYLIGGYSGGGITAYEMAQQLTAAGDEVALLVLLDTPALKEPPLTLPKRLSLARQRIARQGPAFFAEAIRRKLDDRRRAIRLLVNKPMARLKPTEFRRERIEAAFYNALDSYQLRKWAGRVALFRPPQVEAYTLGPGHVVNLEGSWVEPLNGWRPWIDGEIDLQVVPGDHDNMVLEPHVRVLAARMRAAFDAARSQSGLGAAEVVQRS